MKEKRILYAIGYTSKHFYCTNFNTYILKINISSLIDNKATKILFNMLLPSLLG